MADNKFSRRGFLKMLGLGAAAPIIPRIPTPQIKDSSSAPTVDIVAGNVSGNVFIGYPADGTVRAGDVLAITPAPARVIMLEPNGKTSRPVGIALNDAEEGENVQILVSGTF